MPEPTRCYLAGAMSGIPEHNFPAFRRAADALRFNGWQVVSPVEMDESEGFDSATAPDVAPGSEEWAGFLARDVKVVADPTIRAVVVLPGWERSRGAALEVHVARELGKPVYAWPGMERVMAPTKYQPPSEETVLETAARLVDGDRGEAYGHPAEDFQRTAMIWTAVLRPKLREGAVVDERDVPLCMVGVKISRLVQSPDHRDSVVDGPGYFRTYEAVLARDGVPGFRDLGPRD